MRRRANIQRQVERLEDRFGDPRSCPACGGDGKPLARVEFESGEEAVELGGCPLCRGAGSRERGAKLYRLPSRALYDAV